MNKQSYFLILTTLFCLSSMSFAEDFSLPSYFTELKSLNIPAVKINGPIYSQDPEDIPEGSAVKNTSETKAYSLVLKLDENNNHFYIEAIKAIPNYEYYLKTLRIGATRDEVIETLGTPDEITLLTHTSMAMGAVPLNLTEGTPYEDWKYIVDGIVYVVWFAGTSDVPKEEWLLQGVASYPVGSMF